jgi:hypothetical protein
LIRLRTAIRLYPALWLGPVLIVMCSSYVVGYILRDPTVPYVTGLSSQPVTTLGLIVPIAAGLAAWEAARLRRGGLWDFPAVRGRLAVSSVPLALIWGVSVLSVTAGVLTALIANGLLVPDPRPLIVVAVVVAAHTLGGFALGLRLPVTVAAPAAMIVSFVWQVMIRTVQPGWTHLLTGQSLEACCSPDIDLAPVAVVAPVLVGLGIAAAGCVLIVRRPSVVTLAFAGVLLLAGLVPAASLASTQPTGDPYVPRGEDQLVCAASIPAVCVWPEHRALLDETAAVVARAAGRWSSIGLDVPARFDEDLFAVPRENTAHFGLGVVWSRDQLVDSLSYAMLPPWTDCPGAYLGVPAVDYLRAYYALTAGMSPSGLQQVFAGIPSYENFDVLTVVHEVAEQNSEAQLKWVTRNDAALRACDRRPQLDPSA